MSVGLVLYRYAVNGRSALSFTEQHALLETLQSSKPIAYRKSDPTPDEYDTFLMQPKNWFLEGHKVLSWIVVRELRSRTVVRADRERDLLVQEMEATDEAQSAGIVTIPLLGIAAVEDRGPPNHLSAASAVSRFEAIVQKSSDCEARFEEAGTSDDVRRAISTWDISEFKFDARPFNPHPRTPGDVLSELLDKDDVGTFREIALPKEGKSIQPKDEGIVKEVLGLAKDGYATYGAKGQTPSGATAIVKKQPFSHDKHRNLEKMRGPQKLRVQIDYEDSEKDRVHQVVKVMLEFFQQGEEP